MRTIVMAVMLAWIGLTSPAFASGGGGDSGGATGNFLMMDPLVVNIRVGEGSGYLNFVPQLKLLDPADGEIVKAYMPVVRHALIKTLIGQNGATLQSIEFMGSFSHKAAEIINQALDGEYVKEVFFDRWVIQ